ncbi:DUF397 domain-containing protein [Streptomyces sp. BPTC-684]|uniref:DUF397 domain-containing protein n=1 Tax=Streptomyces sp. BPTC-684 TaxID=3043734 RepID=UPI0024B0A6D7|nr:DUF397 domain-containing protein [Streptomyces sp. BPTC-684]WHM40223.1 DUF397 domain-containing protein [Streptomyces sp. BPTC-684]
MNSYPPAPQEHEWVVSTYSGPEGGNCLQWAPAHAVSHGVVPVRDSKRPIGPVLNLSPSAFAGLVAYAKQSR